MVDDEGKAKKAQKLTGEMMRKLGLNDPKRMVDEHEEGQKRAANGRVNGDPSPALAVSVGGEEEEEEEVSKAQAWTPPRGARQLRPCPSRRSGRRSGQG